MHKMRSFCLLLLACWGATRCGSTASAGNGPAEGFSLPYSIAVYRADPTDSNDIPGLSLFLTDASNLCELVKNARLPKNAQLAEILLATQTMGQLTSPQSPGDYNVPSILAVPPDGNYASFGYQRLGSDPNCTPDVSDAAKVGTVTLSAVGNSSTATQGSYHVTLDDNTTISGTFAAVPCIVDANILEEAPVCD